MYQLLGVGECDTAFKIGASPFKNSRICEAVKGQTQGHGNLWDPVNAIQSGFSSYMPTSPHSEVCLIVLVASMHINTTTNQDKSFFLILVLSLINVQIDLFISKSHAHNEVHVSINVFLICSVNIRKYQESSCIYNQCQTFYFLLSGLLWTINPFNKDISKIS